MTKDEAEKMVDALQAAVNGAWRNQGYEDHAEREGKIEAARAALIAALTATPGVPGDYEESVKSLANKFARGVVPNAQPTDTLLQMYARIAIDTLAAAPPAPVVSTADAVAAEREALAKIVENLGCHPAYTKAAAAIRARGQGGAT
jgi:hypothetical protein